MRTKHVLILAVAIFLVGCSAAFGGKPDWWRAQEKTSDEIAIAATAAVPYPLAAIKTGGFIERKNLAERIKRFSVATKIGYVYILSFGKFLGYYTIEGKISSTQSQLTNTTQTWNGSGDSDPAQVDAIGDDGSFGPNEDGVFFFTTGGVMVQTNLDYVYSDAPLNVGDVPQLLK